MQSIAARTFLGKSVVAAKATAAAKRVSVVPVKADIYPEFGTYPGGGESPVAPYTDEKNAEREIIHGRF
eukprot:9716658-Ditylum_brightwellii.AAC.1